MKLSFAIRRQLVLERRINRLKVAAFLVNIRTLRFWLEFFGNPIVIAAIVLVVMIFCFGAISGMKWLAQKAQRELSCVPIQSKIIE